MMCLVRRACLTLSYFQGNKVSACGRAWQPGGLQEFSAG